MADGLGIIPSLEVARSDGVACIYHLGVDSLHKQEECGTISNPHVESAVPALQVVIGPQKDAILASGRRREDGRSNPLTLDVSKVVMHFVVLWETLGTDSNCKH